MDIPGSPKISLVAVKKEVLIYKDSYVFQVPQDRVRVNMIIKKLSTLVIKQKKLVKATSIHLYVLVCVYM